VCCSVLQCVAVCCSVLQCVAVCCSVLHCVLLKYVEVRCSVTSKRFDTTHLRMCHESYRNLHSTKPPSHHIPCPQFSVMQLQYVAVCGTVLQCAKDTSLPKSAQPPRPMPKECHPCRIPVYMSVFGYISVCGYVSVYCVDQLEDGMRFRWARHSCIPKYMSIWHANTHTHMSTCVYDMCVRMPCVRINLYIRLSTFTCIYQCVYMYGHACKSVYIHIHTCACVYVHARIMHVNIHECKCT